MHTVLKPGRKTGLRVPAPSAAAKSFAPAKAARIAPNASAAALPDLAPTPANWTAAMLAISYFLSYAPATARDQPVDKDRETAPAPERG